jgi:hypothetical protein
MTEVAEGTTTVDTSTSDTTATSQDNTNAAATVDASAGGWLNQLPQEIREHEAMKGIETVESLAQKRVDSFTSQPVVPATPADYKFDLPEGYVINDVEMNQFKDLAHSLNMPQDIAAKLIAFDSERVNRAIETHKKNEQAELNKAEVALKNEWGQEYEVNLALANKVVERFGNEELKTALADSGFGRHPLFVQMFHAIAAAMSEDTLAGGEETRVLETDGPKIGEYGQPQLKFPNTPSMNQ